MKAKRKKIYLHEVRDFGAIMTDTLRFIRQNAGDIVKALIFVGGPFVLGFTMLYMLYQNEIGEFHLYLDGKHRRLDYQMDMAFFWMVVGTGMYLGRVFLASTAAVYLKLYEDKGKGNFTTADISKMLMKKVWKILGTALIVVVLLWLIVGGILVLTYMLSQLSEPLGVLFFVLGVIAAFIFYFPLTYLNASLFMVVINYNLSGFKALRLASRIMKGNFWTAWLVFFIASLVMIGLYYLFQLPLNMAGILQDLFSGEGAHEYERYGLFMMFITLLMNFIFTMADGFYFFFCHFLFYSNLESKSGTGLKNRVLEIGTNKSYHDVEPSY